MPIYGVIFHPDAAEEALAAAEYIAQEAPLNASRWYEGLAAAIGELAKFPNRCPLAPESEFLGVPLRHFVYHSHRIIYVVDEKKKTVRILHVRHAAQKTVGQPELDDDE